MILAIDTATRWTGIALASEESLLASSGWWSLNRKQTQTMEVAPQIQRILNRTGITAADLSGIAVAIGPGSYTGLRIGLGIAKGLALPFQTPILAVPTFDIVMAALPKSPEPVVAVLEAGRKRIIAVEYRAAANGEWGVSTPADIIEWGNLFGRLTEPTHIVGELSEAARTQMDEVSLAMPMAPAACERRPALLAQLGRERLMSGQIASPDRLTPAYLRAPDGS